MEGTCYTTLGMELQKKVRFAEVDMHNDRSDLTINKTNHGLNKNNKENKSNDTKSQKQ